MPALPSKKALSWRGRKALLSLVCGSGKAGDRSLAHLVERAGLQNLVVLVLDGEGSDSSQPHAGYALVIRGQPEIPNFHVIVVNVGLLDPKGRILGGLAFNPANREVLRINPDPAAEEKLVGNLGFNSQNIGAAV